MAAAVTPLRGRSLDRASGERSVTLHSTVPLAHRQYIRQANEARALHRAGGRAPTLAGVSPISRQGFSSPLLPPTGKVKECTGAATSLGSARTDRSSDRSRGRDPSGACLHTYPIFQRSRAAGNSGARPAMPSRRRPRTPKTSRQKKKKKKEKVRKQPAKCTSIYATVKLKEKGGGGRIYISFFFFRSPIIKLKLWCGAVFTHPRIYTPPIYTHAHTNKASKK